MTVYVYVKDVPSQCGGKIIAGFSPYSDYNYFLLREVKHRYTNYMLIATFNQNQKAYYEECCKEFTLLGQSTPIKNPNTKNFIFTAIFKA